MKTTFKDIKEIRKGYHKMPDGTIMKDSDHPKKVKEEELEERVKASAATRAKLATPLDSRTKSAMELKVKNMISDLDNMAWQLENQIQLRGDEGPHWPKSTFLIAGIDYAINQVTKLQKAFKSDLKV